ncbi:putative malate transporter YflS [Oxobacter pfennigii]|uniref:Putative malate transporter YflS n=1 Tax=Oxobacter pfennigii TaxID=36849 RepID=A0A0P8X487_9CLOT|nr:SLC13 family permease [Oxobacter pfennigii]KPU45609.1 putative malate transporter YflS [Oxobacter pfennigii]
MVNETTVSQVEKKPKTDGNQIKKMACLILGVAGFLYPMYLMPSVNELSPEAQRALGVFLFMVFWWIGNVIDGALVGLVGMVMFTVFGVVDMKTAFAGFSDSTLIFLIFAFLMANAVTKTNLHTFLAFKIMSKVNPSYKVFLFMVVMLPVILAAIVPSGTARLVLVATISTMLLKVFGMPTDKMSNIGRGFFSSIGVLALHSSGPFMTAGASTVATIGILEKAGIKVTYFQWTSYILPLVIIGAILLWLIIPKVFPPEKTKLTEEEARELKEKFKNEAGSMTKQGKIVAVLIGAVLFFWLTGDLFKLDFMNVAFVGISIMFLPGIEVLGTKDLKGLDWGSLVFVACAMSLGAILQKTGLAEFLGNILGPYLYNSNVFLAALILVLIAYVVHIFIPSLVVAIGAFGPIIMAVYTNMGMNPMFGLLAFFLGYGGYFLMYQMTHSLVAYGYGQFSQNDFMKIGGWYMGIWIVMIPVMIIWFKIVGVI